ncbi:MAG: hypothetical protein CVU77_01450 [Elusimicrobia bacterium HGW-Elusimicrobia-1]|jgi:CheY-like chemotaxis protein|nr:MAG: hypothetical protein CVU77_01450 [Elusimicrobia bacterium HGW-Elusimicrobia-1]
MSRKLLKISEAAKLVGVLPSTIRYYTDIGLLKSSDETKGGHRLYDPDDVAAIVNKIKFLSARGLTMDAIKKELAAGRKSKKILVIDDEPEVGNLVRDVAAEKFPDAEVKIVYDGFTAGRALSDYLPDLIVLDLMLPGINGFEVCKQIRASKFMNGVKILAVTGYDTTENKERIMKSGADDYLAKPLEVAALAAKIKKMIL